MIKCEPHVSMKLKQLFTKIYKGQFGTIKLSATDENSRDLEWFLNRYPMVVENKDVLGKKARTFDQLAADTYAILRDDYAPPEYANMALPPRDYQKIAAILGHKVRGLLVADELGLGKTISAIAMLSMPGTLPALVVCPTHLPGQWKSELERFLPGIRVHITKKVKPYGLDTPDVVITNYHKLHGWAEHLANYVNTVIYDEVQELRRDGSNGIKSQKYAAAEHVSHHTNYRLGLSVGPTSTIELRGGPFGDGWVGGISEAWDRLACNVQKDAGGYEIVDCTDDVESRGWTGEMFGWKNVRKFIRHECDRRTRRIKLGGSHLIATDDHSVFVAEKNGFIEKQSCELTKGDIVPVDDGRDWSLGIEEKPIDVVSMMHNLDRAQVTVNLSQFSRHDFDLTAWQWQNCHKEASYGPRLPIDVYLKHRAILPEPSMVYVGRGKAAALPASLLMSEWAYVLGFYIGDGWVSDGTLVAFAVENDRVDDFVQRLEALGIGLRPKIRRMRGASSEVRCTHKLFALILDHAFGKAKCYNKRIPGEWIVSWSRNARMDLLRGLLDSDGHVNHQSRNRARAYFTTTSSGLVQDVTSLLRSVSVRAGIHERKATRGGCIDGRAIIGRRPSYQVHWSLAQMVGNTTGKRGHQKRFSGAYNEAKVTTSEKISAPNFVYDLEMDGHPSFVANGMLVHNSATPIYNYGGEFFNIFQCLSPGMMGERSEFLREWCVSYGRDDKARIQDPKAFGTYLRESGRMLLRTKKDVGRELPSLNTVVQEVESDPKHLKKIEDSASELASFIVDSSGAKGFEIMQASQEFSNKLRQATGLAKAPYVAEFVNMLIESTDEKILLFGWHREVYNIWASKLFQHHAAWYTGSESPAKKQKELNRFIKDPKCKVMMMSLRAGSGIDGLQNVCSRVVIGELDWSPGAIEQCVGRVHRDGQPFPVFAYYPVAVDGADPIMVDVLGLKRAQLEGVKDPEGDIVTKSQIDPNHVKKLAAKYLEKRGKKSA